MLYVSFVTYKISRDGMKVGRLMPSRGLRQCDPLSPYLFIICVEGLSSLINHYERACLLHRVRIARGASCFTHLSFANNCFLFFKTSVQEAHVMKIVLFMYRAVSGQKVNYNKSSISFNANVEVDSTHSICNLI